MKKLFSLVTVVLCVVMLSTSAFAATIDPMAVYQEYLKKEANISSMNLSISQRISMVDGEDSVDVLKQDIATKIILANDDLQMEMRTVDASTEEIAYSYFRNNYMYQQIGDEKYKIKMDVNQALASTAAIDTNISEDILKNATMQPLLDGVKITYKMDLKDLMDGQGNPITDMLNNMNLPADMKMDISAITTTMTIGYDGVLKNGSNKFGVRISSGDINLELRVNQTFRVNSVNSVDHIIFPADLGDYKLLEV